MEDATNHLPERSHSPDITCLPFSFTNNNNTSSVGRNRDGGLVNRGSCSLPSTPPPHQEEEEGKMEGEGEGGGSGSGSSSTSSLGCCNSSSNSSGGGSGVSSPSTSSGGGGGGGGGICNGNGNLTVVHNVSRILEVPEGLYEFVVGESGEVRILCKVCQYISNKKSNFKRHFTNMHFVHTEESKQLECCGIRFSTKGDKFQHTKSVHKFGYKCVICSKVFDRPALLQRHLAKHTGKKPYKCSLCTYQTPNKANAKRHIEKKHSDVQQGSILFVTEDGEQIQLEVVSKNGKGAVDLSKSSTSNMPQSSPSSPNYGGGIDPACYMMTMASTPIPILPPGNSFSLEHSRRCPPPSATVTSSSSASSPENPRGGGDPLLESIFGVDVKYFQQDDPADGKKKRQISHSIDKIMKEPAESLAARGSQASSAPVAATTALSSSSEKQINVPIYNYFPKVVSHPPAINQQHQLNWYCPPDWPRSSALSLLPFNSSRNDIKVGSNNQSSAHHQQHPGIVSSSSTFPPQQALQASSTNQGSSSSSSSPFVFRQCPHGCWHPVLDNQNQNENQNNQTPTLLAQQARTTSDIFPDLRFSSAFTSPQQTASMSMSFSSFKTEEDLDEDDTSSSELIDVVGEDDDDNDEEEEEEQDEEDTICEGLGSCTTSIKEEATKTSQLIHTNNNNNINSNGKMMGEGETLSRPQPTTTRPPVVVDQPISLSRRSSLSSSAREDRDRGDVVDGQDPEAEELTYIPKKLRVSRAYCN